MIPLYKLLQINNRQSQPITKEQLLDFVDNMDLKGKFYDVFSNEEMYDNVPPVKPMVSCSVKILI